MKINVSLFFRNWKMVQTCARIHHCSLHWRHNGHDSVSNHQLDDCLLNRLFRRRSKKISKLRVTGLCGGNSPETGEFRAQMASNAENISIWWRHHVSTCFYTRVSVMWITECRLCTKFIRLFHGFFVELQVYLDSIWASIHIIRIKPVIYAWKGWIDLIELFYVCVLCACIYASMYICIYDILKTHDFQYTHYPCTSSAQGQIHSIDDKSIFPILSVVNEEKYFFRTTAISRPRVCSIRTTGLLV